MRKAYYDVISGIMRTLLPVTLLIYFNLRILSVVYKNRLGSKRRKGPKSNSRITLMLVTILGTFVLCVFPDSCMTMMQLGYANEKDYFVRGLREITDLLMALNSAANFPICLHFSIEFRLKFRELFAARAKPQAGPVARAG